jgi:hypothetical protein
LPSCHHLEHCGKRGARMRFGVLLHVAHAYVGRIEDTGGLQIKAAPPALVIR